MASQYEKKKQYPVRVGGMEFDAGNEEVYRRAERAISLIHEKQKTACLGRLEGQTHSGRGNAHAEAMRAANSYVDSRAGLEDFKTTYALLEKAEQKEQLAKQERTQAMEAANQRGIERGNLKVQAPQTQSTDMER